MNLVWFLIKEGFYGLIRSKYSGAFAILIITIALIMVGFGYIAARDTLFAVENIRSQFDVVIFLKPTAGAAEITGFGQLLKNRAEILTAVYISPDSAAVRFKTEFGEDILDLFDFNPLPPAYSVRLKPIYRNLISVESITTMLAKETAVDEIKYRKQFLITLEKYQRTILITVLSTFTLLTLISIVLISNTIKMTIFARRDVISTMRLVGATKRFIRAPFLIEGALEGLIGAMLAVGIIYSTFYVVNRYLHTIIEYQAVVSLRYYAGLVILGTLLGIIGSQRAIRKFL